jgi:hypothetical protein
MWTWSAVWGWVKRRKNGQRVFAVSKLNFATQQSKKKRDILELTKENYNLGVSK